MHAQNDERRIQPLRSAGIIEQPAKPQQKTGARAQQADNADGKENHRPRLKARQHEPDEGANGNRG
jgi:hypothetical protein